MGIKSAVSEWLSEKWNKHVKQPIANKTQELENSVQNQANTYGNKAKQQVRKPIDYYWKQDAFYRGLFWIAVVLLIILWILSGS